MGTKKYGSLLVIAAYLAIAGLILGYLITLASSGGISVSGATRTYGARIPSAPGLNPNKSDVVNPAGVKVGVVTFVQRDGESAVIKLKVTDGKFPVHKNSDVQVITKTILGEKALMITPGTSSSGTASDGGTLTASARPKLSEPDQALGPLAGLTSKLAPVDAGDLLANVRKNLVPVLGQLDSAFSQIDKISKGVGPQGEALNRIAGRTQALIQVINTKDTDIESVVQSLAVLTNELTQLVTQNIQTLNDILVASSQLSAAIAQRNAELDLALSQLPQVLDRLQTILNSTIQAFSGNRQFQFYGSLGNIPTQEHLLAILEGRA